MKARRRVNIYIGTGEKSLPPKPEIFTAAMIGKICII